MTDKADQTGETAPLLLTRTTDKMRALLKEPSAGTTPPSPTSHRPARSVRGKLGFAGAVVAAMLVWVAIFADLLAGDLPIACKVQQKTWLFPNITHPVALTSLSAAELAARTEWKIGPLVSSGPTTWHPDERLAPPGTRGHPLGTDVAGRDVFSRLVFGTRNYLGFAFAAVLLSLFVGGVAGGVAGLKGGPLDALVGRAIETVSSFPPLVLVVGIQAAVPRPTLGTLFIAIALSRWPEVARLVRGEVIRVATQDYVLAARALGASPLRILRKHIAPNVRGQLAVLAAVGVPAVILIEASLDFLRVGAPAGAASWGETMSEFRDATHAWWLLAFPGLLLLATVVAVNLVGEARRESLDPRSR